MFYVLSYRCNNYSEICCGRSCKQYLQGFALLRWELLPPDWMFGQFHCLLSFFQKQCRRANRLRFHVCFNLASSLLHSVRSEFQSFESQELLVNSFSIFYSTRTTCRFWDVGAARGFLRILFYFSCSRRGQKYNFCCWELRKRLFVFVFFSAYVVRCPCFVFVPVFFSTCTVSCFGRVPVLVMLNCCIPYDFFRCEHSSFAVSFLECFFFFSDLLEKRLSRRVERFFFFFFPVFFGLLYVVWRSCLCFFAPPVSCFPRLSCTACWHIAAAVCTSFRFTNIRNVGR